MWRSTRRNDPNGVRRTHKRDRALATTCLFSMRPKWAEPRPKNWPKVFTHNTTTQTSTETTTFLYAMPNCVRVRCTVLTGPWPTWFSWCLELSFPRALIGQTKLLVILAFAARRPAPDACAMRLPQAPRRCAPVTSLHRLGGWGVGRLAVAGTSRDGRMNKQA
jgi:hypothetical protein